MEGQYLINRELNKKKKKGEQMGTSLLYSRYRMAEWVMDGIKFELNYVLLHNYEKRFCVETVCQPNTFIKFL